MQEDSSSNNLGENVPKLRFPGFEGEWRLISISELLDLQNGINADSDKYGNGIKYISVSDILNNPYICYDDIKGLVDIDNSTLEHYKVEYGDIVFQRSSETFEDIGHANVYLDKLRPATFGGFVIRGKKKGSYMPFFFKNLLDTAYARKVTTRMGAGAQHYNIGQDGLSRIALYFPEMAEQEKIADLFMILNKKTQLQKELIETLKLYKRGLLAKLFPQKGESVPQYRFAGFTGAWEQHKLGEVLTSLQNNTLSRAELSNKRGIALNIHYGDILIKFGEYLDVKKETLPLITDNKVVAKYKTSFLKNGDVIVADTAEDKTVGKCSEIVGLTDEIAISGLHTIPYRPLMKFAFGYLGYYMNSTSYHSQLFPLMQGIKVTSISKSAMQNTIICYPKSEVEQKKIGEYFRNIDHLITLHQQKIHFIEEVKSALLQQMFI